MNAKHRRTLPVIVAVLVAGAIGATLFLKTRAAKQHTDHQSADGTSIDSVDDDIAYYTCPMHPSVKQKEPGACPICGMNLTPVTKQDTQSGVVTVDEGRRQKIGVRTEVASIRDLTLEIRAVGRVQYDETRLSDVNLRMSGWVQRLFVAETGQPVKKGQALFTLYSPELYAAQLEHLASMSRGQTSRTDTLSDLAQASRQRLRLLGMADSAIKQLETGGVAQENASIVAPTSGYVVEKNIVEGGRIEAGTRVYRIADLRRVWVDAEVYESDLPHVRVGQAAHVELPYAQGRAFEGKVDYIYPTLEKDTRTARVRVVLANQGFELKPDMYANVALEVPLSSRLAVPESAVIYTGPRRIVFVDLGEGRLRPTEIQLGVHAGTYYEVTEGLSDDDVVVTSGNFLIAAESRIRSAATQWSDGAPRHEH